MPRVPKEAFRGHTIVHHGLYKGDDSYFVADDQHPEHILLKPYALPAIVLIHLPLMIAVDRYLIHHTLIGSLTATILYFVVYEYMHWNMHVPRRHFVERFAWFRFLRQHHKLHHRYYMKNFCVLFPLADLCFGTLATEQSIARQKAERERAIANGGATALRKDRALRRDAPGGETKAQPSGSWRDFAKSETRRVGKKYRARTTQD